MRNTMPITVTVCSGHDPGITGHVEPEYSSTSVRPHTLSVALSSDVIRYMSFSSCCF